MTALSTIRRKLQSPAKLAVLAFVWVAVLTMPCTMVVASPTDSPIAEQTSHSDAHSDKCHGDSEAGKTKIVSADCCCESGDIQANTAFEQIQFVALLQSIAQPIDFDISFGKTPVFSQLPAVHATSPPIYFSTQRFRI